MRQEQEPESAGMGDCLQCNSHRSRVCGNNHIYNNHPEWITHDKDGRQMRSSEQFGYFIDPGIPEVQNISWMFSVISVWLSGVGRFASGIHPLSQFSMGLSPNICE
jgi:hypothetical protein